MDNINDIQKLYELSDEAISRQADIIYAKSTYKKHPTDRPIAIIVIGQPGAGKSGLMSYSENQFPSAVALDIDDFRAYHPKYDEVKKNDPKYFESVTGGFATKIIHLLTPRLIQDGHNLILHKTRGDDAVIYDTIIPLQEKGYDVILRVLAVNHLESKISALDRSISERERFDCCRWVKKDYHNTQYKGIPILADKIEKKKYADAIEVYTRGKEMKFPVLQYAHVVTDKIETNPNLQTVNGENAIVEYNAGKYKSTIDAINKAREIDVPKILKGLDDRMKGLKARAVVGDEQEYIDEIEEIAANYNSLINNK